LIQPGVGTIHYGALPAARAFTGLAVLQGAMFICLVLLAVWAMRERVSSARDRLWWRWRASRPISSARR